MKKATVYERRGEIFVHSLSRTTAGVWILNPPCMKSSSEDAQQIGLNVATALVGSRLDVLHPTDWRGIFDPVLRAAGVKSWGTFIKGTRSVDVEDEGGDWISLLPTRNLGAEEGFEPVVERMIRVGKNPAEIGTAVQSALETSE